MVELHEKYHEQGLEILAFPCNQFGSQEPGDADAIEAFAESYGVQFRMMEKVKVNGPSSHPAFVYLKNEKPGLLAAVKWNFTKFLVDREGNVVKRVEPKTAANTMAPAIEELLENSAPKL